MKTNTIHTFVILAYKESEFLEACIKSTINQTKQTNIIIATTTDNEYIRNLANKYKLDVIVGEHKNIGGDFDFAKNAAKTELVTIAHQDDIYDPEYAENVIHYYNKYKNSTIIFSDYYEIRNNKKIESNSNLKIKRILISPLKMRLLSNRKIIKRLILSLGNSICCPAVTFVNSNCSKEVFTCDLKSNVDWYAWEKLSKIKGNFTYVPKRLMGHRVDETTTTSDIIKQGIRTKEDLIMFEKFWPKKIARLINQFYSNSEKSNEIMEEKK